MKNLLLPLSVGFALFSMFFGSGNLVFPMIVGVEASTSPLWASLGFAVTGVLVPLLGCFVILLNNGQTERFFGLLGKSATFWLPLFFLSIMGPFGVIARCIVVAYGSFQLLFPTLSSLLFNALACLTIFLLTWRKSQIVPILGNILTPLLLLALGTIVGVGFWTSNLSTVSLQFESQSLFNGLFIGYQTMDLIAAFFFAAFVMQDLSTRCKDSQLSLIPTFWKTAFTGALLLGIVYVALILLAAIYSPELQGIAPENRLPTLAFSLLGAKAGPIICLAITLSCLTTAIVLASLFADFFSQRVTQGKVAATPSLILTLLIAFGFASLDFAGISRYLGPILDVTYPLLIALTISNIAYRLIKSREAKSSGFSLPN